MQKKGFTILEVIIVAAVIFILAAIVYVIIDPVKRLNEAEDIERTSAVNSLLSSYLKYIIDHDGVEPIDNNLIQKGVPYMISNGSSGKAALDCPVQSLDQRVDFSTIVGSYMAELPVDPNNTRYSQEDTGYYFIKREKLTPGEAELPSTQIEIVIGACNPETVKFIEVSR